MKPHGAALVFTKKIVIGMQVTMSPGMEACIMLDVASATLTVVTLAFTTVVSGK